MVTVKNEWDGWEFRALRNGEVESCNEKLNLDWAVRSAAQIGYFDDHIAIIWNTLNELSAILPREGFEIPKTEPFTIPQPQEYNEHL